MLKQAASLLFWLLATIFLWQFVTRLNHHGRPPDKQPPTEHAVPET